MELFIQFSGRKHIIVACFRSNATQSIVFYLCMASMRGFKQFLSVVLSCRVNLIYCQCFCFLTFHVIVSKIACTNISNFPPDTGGDIPHATNRQL